MTRQMPLRQIVARRLVSASTGSLPHAGVSFPSSPVNSPMDDAPKAFRPAFSTIGAAQAAVETFKKFLRVVRTFICTLLLVANLTFKPIIPIRDDWVYDISNIWRCNHGVFDHFKGFRDAKTHKNPDLDH